jgi:hypothetical protein
MAMALPLQISLENLSTYLQTLVEMVLHWVLGLFMIKIGHIITNDHVVPDTSNTASKLVDVANKL